MIPIVNGVTYIALPSHWSPRSLSGGLLSDESWSGPSVRYLRCDQDSPDILEHRRTGSDYIVHAGTLGDLSRPGPDLPPRGETAALSIDVVTEAPSTKSIVVDLAVVEFDGQGVKSRVTFVPADAPAVHVLRGDCDTFRIALRIRGAGRIRLRHVGVAPLAERTRAAWNHPSGVAPFVAALVRRAAPVSARLDDTAPRRRGSAPATLGMFDPLTGGSVLWPAAAHSERTTRMLARSLESTGEQWLRREALTAATDAEIEATAAHHVVATADDPAGPRRLSGLLSRGLSVVTDQSAWVRRDFPQVHAAPVEQDLSFLGRPLRRHEAAARTAAAWEAIDRLESESPTRPRLRVLVLHDRGDGAQTPEPPRSVDLLVRSLDDFPLPETLDAFCRREGVDVLVPIRSGDRHGIRYLHSRVLPFLSLEVARVVQPLSMADLDRRQRDGEPLSAILAECHVAGDAPGDVWTSGLSLAAAPASAWLWGVPAHGPSFAVDPFELDCPPGMLFADPEPTAAGLPTSGPELTVVVPVYNNGRHLMETALPSLARQECWPRMRVMLVDDGSTDGVTEDVCRSLAEHCPRITAHLFGDGGSGSASRPRNWGVEHARTELVSFLDPDNEISPGGYDRLLELYADGVAADRTPDLVSGYQVKVGDDVRVMARHAFGDRVVKDARREFFRGRHFPTVSTQAAVLRTGFLRSSGIRFVESASGEDTLYGWEVLLAAEHAVFTDRAHLVYVADRSDSVTNDASAKLFHKHLVVEHARLGWLQENDLVETFCSGQLQRSLDAWYAPLLERVTPSERAEAEAVLAEIVALYPTPNRAEAPQAEAAGADSPAPASEAADAGPPASSTEEAARDAAPQPHGD